MRPLYNPVPRVFPFFQNLEGMVFIKYLKPGTFFMTYDETETETALRDML